MASLSLTATNRERRVDPAGALARKRRTQQLCAVLLSLAGVSIVMAIITGEALFPVAYGTAHNTISDLGSTWQPGNIVREPSATIFNVTMLAAGTMIVGAAASFYVAYRSRPVATALLLVGVGMLGVGLFPGTEIGGHFSSSGLHPVFSTLTFLAGGLSAVLTCRVTRSPFRVISASLGLVSLLALVLSSPLGESTLGPGGTERWVAYPVILWLVAFGGYLLGRSDTPTPRGTVTPRVPLPLAAPEPDQLASAAPLINPRLSA